MACHQNWHALKTGYTKVIGSQSLRPGTPNLLATKVIGSHCLVPQFIWNLGLSYRLRLAQYHAVGDRGTDPAAAWWERSSHQSGTFGAGPRSAPRLPPMQIWNLEAGPRSEPIEIWNLKAGPRSAIKHHPQVRMQPSFYIW